MAGHRLGALEGGYLPPFQCIPGAGGGVPKTVCLRVTCVKDRSAATASGWHKGWRGPGQWGCCAPVMGTVS